jgi:hypothetical protein
MNDSVGNALAGGIQLDARGSNNKQESQKATQTAPYQ